MRSIVLLFPAIIGSVFLLLLHVPAQTLSAKPEMVVSAYPSGVSVGGGTGVAVFQDIQVPINDELGMRGDGKLPAEEFQNHIGLALHGHVGYNLSVGRVVYVFGLDVMQARSTNGPAATQSSSYSRYHLGSGAYYRLSPEWQAGVTLGLRRSSFNNVSTGHFIDSLLTGVSTSVDLSRNWNFRASAAAAPQSGFHYNDGKGWAGNAFETSTTSLAEYKLESAHHVYETTWVTFGLAQEVANVSIPDVAEYNTFGLNVTPTEQPGRDYNLSTTELSIGFDKRF